jgi:hypothetical protein
LRQTVMGVVLTVGPCGFFQKTQERKAGRPEIPFPQFSKVFWFLFWFDGDLIHFQTTIPNRMEKADSSEMIDSIDILQRNHRRKKWCARREFNPQPSASEVAGRAWLVTGKARHATPIERTGHRTGMRRTIRVSRLRFLGFSLRPNSFCNKATS